MANTHDSFSSTTKMEHKQKHNATLAHAADTESDTDTDTDTNQAIHRDSVFSEEDSCGSESDNNHCMKALTACGILDLNSDLVDLEQSSSSQPQLQYQQGEEEHLLDLDALVQQDTKNKKALQLQQKQSQTQLQLQLDLVPLPQHEHRLQDQEQKDDDETETSSQISRGSLASSASTLRDRDRDSENENENEKQLDADQDLEEAMRMPLLATATGIANEDEYGIDVSGSKDKKGKSKKTAGTGIAIAISTTVLIAVLVTILLACGCHSHSSDSTDSIGKRTSSDSIIIDNSPKQIQKNVKILNVNQQSVVVDGKPCVDKQGKQIGANKHTDMESNKQGVNNLETDVNRGFGNTNANRFNASSSAKKTKGGKRKNRCEKNGNKDQNQKQDNKDGSQYEDANKIDGKQNENQRLVHTGKRKDNKQQIENMDSDINKVGNKPDDKNRNSNSDLVDKRTNKGDSNSDKSEDQQSEDSDSPPLQGEDQEIESEEENENSGEHGKKEKNINYAPEQNEESTHQLKNLKNESTNSNGEPNIMTPEGGDGNGNGKRPVQENEKSIDNQGSKVSDKLPTVVHQVQFGCIAKDEEQDMLDKVNEQLGLKQTMNTPILGKKAVGSLALEQIIFIGSLEKCKQSKDGKKASKDARTMVVTTKGVYNFDFTKWIKSYMRWAIPIEAVEFNMNFSENPKITLITLTDKYRALKKYPKPEGQAYIFEADKAHCIQSFISAIKEGQKFSKGKTTLETAHDNVFAAGMKRIEKGQEIDTVVKNMSKGNADILRKAESSKNFGENLETGLKVAEIVVKGLGVLCKILCAIGKGCADGC